jgi:hypothetical protein
MNKEQKRENAEAEEMFNAQRSMFNKVKSKKYITKALHRGSVFVI